MEEAPGFGGHPQSSASLILVHFFENPCNKMSFFLHLSYVTQY